MPEQGVQDERPRGPKAGDRQKYDVLVWDHDIQNWHRHRCRILIRTLRRTLRRLSNAGYDTVSVVVEQADALRSGDAD